MQRPFHTAYKITFPPVNRCIYCGKTAAETRLNDEHIVPFGLYGNMILPKASCEKCSVITSRFERYVLRDMFGPLRNKMNIPDRKKRQPRKREYSVLVEVSRGVFEKRTIPEIDYAYCLYLFELGFPDILMGLPPVTNFRISRPWTLRFFDDESLKKLDKYNKGKIMIGQFHAGKFSRLLAKIAYGYAVAEIGYGSFTPYITDIILNVTETPSYLIGGNLNSPEATKPDEWHVLKIELQDKQNDVDGNLYVIVKVRLFSQLGTPEYVVVVGEITKKQRDIFINSASPAVIIK